MDFDRLLAEGLAASRDGRREAALDLFAEASAADPSSGLPHFLIGSEQASAGDFAAAEPALARAVLLAPGFPLARYQLGLLQFTAGRAAVALLTWEPLLALGEHDALPHLVRGFAALAQDAPGEALEHFRAGLACRPDNPALCADIAQVISALEQWQSGSAAPEEDAGAQHVLLSAYSGHLH